MLREGQWKWERAEESLYDDLKVLRMGNPISLVGTQTLKTSPFPRVSKLFLRQGTPTQSPKMVVIRIKDNEDNTAPRKVSSDGIKMMANLKLCKLVTSDIDERIERRIERELQYSERPRSNPPSGNQQCSGDEDTIFGHQRNTASRADEPLSSVASRLRTQAYDRFHQQQRSARTEFSDGGGCFHDREQRYSQSVERNRNSLEDRLRFIDSHSGSAGRSRRRR
jgi:hypothetical protein